MGIKVIECPSFSSALDACRQEARRLRADYPAVDVVVDSLGAELALKRLFSQDGFIGVRVSALEHWLCAQWDLWGDGSKLASRQQRHLLLRPVLAELTGLAPSSSYVDSFAAFVQDACALGGRPYDEKVLAALESYRALLERASLAEPFAVLDKIASENAGRAFILFSLDKTQARVQQLVSKLGAVADVVVLQRVLFCQDPVKDAADGELAQLRSMLFSGKGGLEPGGGFKAVEVLGVHAENAAVADLIEQALASGTAADAIVVAFPSRSTIPASLPPYLASRGIGVQCRLSMPLRQTAFGSAFLQLEAFLGDEDDGFANSAAFVCSDYSGLDDKTARGLCAIWRGQAGSTHEARLEDVAKGAKGRVSSKAWAVKLARVRSLVEEPTQAGRIKLMLDNAAALFFDEDRLADDLAAANSILDYLSLCEELGCDSSLPDIAELSVSLARSSSGDASRVRIVAAEDLPTLESVGYVVFARLDKDSYPMAQPPSPFDRYLEEMGFRQRPATALKARILLLDAIESAKEGFACFRLATDAEGAERCQSALWDELMTSYRAAADEDAPIQALPAALRDAGCGLRIAEADVFAREGAQEACCFDVRRGDVGPAAANLLFPDFEGYSEAFSPTAIEDYYRCPYRWFICRRVGANPLDKPFDQIAKGNLAHAVLERFYLDLREQGIERVTQDNLDSCLEIANRAFDWQLAHEVQRHRLNLVSARDRQEAQVVRGQVLDLVRRDAAFLPGFAPKYLELKLEDAQGGALTYAGVPVRGKVDRIDVDGEGRAVVIDYKLSGLAAGYGFPKDEGLPTRIQTDIYAVLVQRCLREQGEDITVVGSVYRSYAKNMLRGVYAEGIDWGAREVVRDKYDALPGAGRLESYSEYLARVEETVTSLMERMRQGDIACRPLCDDACEHCLAQGFCAQRRG